MSKLKELPTLIDFANFNKKEIEEFSIISKYPENKNVKDKELIKQINKVRLNMALIRFASYKVRAAKEDFINLINGKIVKEDLPEPDFSVEKNYSDKSTNTGVMMSVADLSAATVCIYDNNSDKNLLIDSFTKADNIISSFINGVYVHPDYYKTIYASFIIEASGIKDVDKREEAFNFLADRKRKIDGFYVTRKKAMDNTR